MAGRDANEAFTNYIEPMREALQCITLQRLTAKRTKRWELGRIYSAALADMNAVRLTGETPLRLVVGQQFQIHRLDDAEDPRGTYKVHTVHYLYEFRTISDDEILGFHWMSS